MSAPSASDPARPASVPVQAVWEAEHRLWRVGSCDAEGRWDGPQSTYRKNGTLQGEFVYVGGKPDGKFRRFHPNGEVSIEGEHRLGTQVGTHTTHRASAGENDEAVHTCCLPPNAWRLLTHYPEDGRLVEDYYDAQGLRLLRDGTPYPERPQSVSPTAWFDPHKAAWTDGNFERGKQHGSFSYWHPNGAVLETSNYKQGQLDGLRERFRDARCIERRMYKAGQPDGPAWERVASERFEDATISAQEGFYERGKPVGKWRYLNASGQIAATVDLGTSVDAVALDDAVLRTVTPQDSLALDPAREHVRSLVWAAHHEPTTLRAKVDAIPQLLPEVSEQLLRGLRNETSEPPQYVAKLLHWLLRGARAEHVFRALSAVYLREPAVAHTLLRVALELAPDELEVRAAEVLVLTGLGRVSAANTKIDQLRERHPGEADELAFNLRVTYPAFGFWPSEVTFGSAVSPELPTQVEQGLTPLREALSKAAQRLELVRHALLAHAASNGPLEFALPPDLSRWITEEPTALDTYSFEARDDEAENEAADVSSDVSDGQSHAEAPKGPPAKVDVVRVDEQLNLAEFSLPELMLQARTEWTTLCWLYFAAGGETLAMNGWTLPTQAVEVPRFGAAMTHAFQTLFRVTDQLMTSGLRSRTQGLADCTWEGWPISRLSRGLLVQAFAEFRERRAALFFAADATCRSAWQDDLRAT